MNRRNFLKRLAAVAAGAVAVPTIAKKLPFKPNPAQKLIIGGYDQHIKGRHVTLTMWDEFAKVPVGTRFVAADGSVYCYMKANRFVKKGQLYVDDSKNNLRHTT